MSQEDRPDWTDAHPQRRYSCADCGERPASIYLPEGRYLCGPCWTALRALRSEVIRYSNRRTLR